MSDQAKYFEETSPNLSDIPLVDINGVELKHPQPVKPVAPLDNIERGEKRRRELVTARFVPNPNYSSSSSSLPPTTPSSSDLPEFSGDDFVFIEFPQSLIDKIARADVTHWKACASLVRDCQNYFNSLEEDVSKEEDDPDPELVDF